MLTELKVGQLIRGTKESDEHFGITDSRMTLGEVIVSDVKPFDLVKVLEHEGRSEVGEEYAVMKINGSYPFELVEKEETAKDELADFFEALLGISKVFSEETEVEEPAVKFTKGDKVKLVSGGGEFPLLGYSNGETYLVEDPAFDHPDGGKIKIVGGTGKPFIGGYADPEQLELVGAEIKVGDLVEIIDNSVTPFDVGDRGTVISIDKVGKIFTYVVTFGGNEQWLMVEHIKVVTETPEPVQELKVGDKVRIIRGGGTDCLHGFENGNICQVMSVDDSIRVPFKLKTAKGNMGYADIEQLEKVADTTPLTGEQVERELKVGDVVEFTEDGDYAGEYLNNGIISKIDEGDSVPYLIFVDGEKVWAEPSDIKLAK